MPYSRPAPTIHRTPLRKGRIAGLLLAVVAAAVLCDQLPASSSSTGPPPVRVPAGEHRPLPGDHRDPPREAGSALGLSGGAVPDGTTVFDDGIPGVANLDPALLDALRRAAADAGVTFLVVSGWRSPEYQAHLLREAVEKYGSEEEAARWVATPDTSAHVAGKAVDIGPDAGAAWLAEHGARYGLCQTYANEPWHYELRAEAVDLGCPRMFADPTQDPRMRR